MLVPLVAVVAMSAGLVTVPAAPAIPAAAQTLRPALLHPCIGTNCPVDHSIGFDDGAVAVGGVVTDQYLGQGVEFVDPSVNGFTSGPPKDGTSAVSADVCDSGPSIFVPGPGLTSSQPNAAEFPSCGPLEFPSHGTFAMFTSGASYVSASVGDVSGSGSFYEIDAYGQDHDLLGSSVVTATRSGLVNAISYSAPSGQYIWAVAIYTRAQGANIKAGFDDLYYSVPKGQAPAVSLSVAHTAIYAIVPSSGSLAVTVNRFNGSTGEIDLSATGMPSGVSVSFSPASLTGTQSQSTLQWHVGSSAYGGADVFHPAGSTITIAATPAVPAAGAGPAPPLSVTMAVSLAFGWRSGLQAATVANCQTVTYYNSGGAIFEPPSNISGTGTFQVSGAGPGTGLSGAALSASTFANGSASPTLSLSTTPTTPVSGTTLTLTASAPGYATQTATLLVHRIVGQVTSWSFANSSGTTVLEAPHWGQGYRLTLNGRGFCPGTKVAFGEYGSPPAVPAGSPALVTPSYISPGGTQLQVTVPHYAANGPIDFITPGGSFATPTDFTMGSGYSAANGFNFANRAGPGVGLSDLAQVFPQSEVYVQVDPCSGLSFGLVNCSLGSTGIGTPQADFFLNNGGAAVAQGGECYGFATSSVYLSGIPGEPNARSVQSFDAHAGNVDQLPDSSALDSYILDNQITQDSNQAQALGSSAKSQASSDTAAQLESQLRSDFVTSNGYLQPVVVNMFATVKGKRSGHAVVAYDVQDAGNGNFDIFVYNPNDPYNSSVSGDSARATSNWVSNQQNSVIHVFSNGSWSFPELAYTGSLSSGNLYLLPSFSLPTSFDLPGSFSFGNILAAVPPSTDLAQVTDGTGHVLFTAAGGQDTSASGIAGAKVIYSVTDNEPASPRALLPLGRTYTLTLAPKGGTSVAGGLIGPLGLVSMSGHSSVPLKLGFDASTGSVTVHLPHGAGEIDANMALTGRAAADRTATLHVAPGASGTLAASWTKQGALALEDHGGRASLSVDLGASGPNQAPASFATRLLHLSSGRQLQLRPANWAHLGSTTVAATATAPGGKLTVTRLRSAVGALRLAALRVSVHPSARTSTFQFRSAISPASAHLAASVIWLIVRGHKVIASHRSAIAVARGRLGARWALKGLAKGSYRVVTTVVVSDNIAGSITAQSAQSSVTRSFKVP
ncbi:MAG TPA: hypothetical protein VFN61_11305 [Acidimicrobiales bacterium]|nr:hypothetical protein [Acidimicrobiales bacterium]